jgi:hypothetical protein
MLKRMFQHVGSNLSALPQIVKDNDLDDSDETEMWGYTTSADGVLISFDGTLRAK